MYGKDWLEHVAAQVHQAKIAECRKLMQAAMRDVAEGFDLEVVKAAELAVARAILPKTTEAQHPGRAFDAALRQQNAQGGLVGAIGGGLQSLLGGCGQIGGYPGGSRY